MNIRPYAVLAKNIALSNVGRLSFPYKLTYAITYRCNSRCTTCNIWQRPAESELGFDEIRTFFQRSNRFSWVHLTGGEIFLRDDLFDVTEVILTECPNLLLLNFPTNGLLTDRIVTTVEKIAALKPPKFFITVSLDGDEAVNDRIRGVKGGWKRQIETFKRLSKISGVDVALGMTLSTANADQVQPTFQVAQAECPWLTYQDFHVNIFHTSSYYGNQESDVSKQDSERLLQAIAAYRKLRRLALHPISYLEYQYGKHIEQYVRSGKTPMHCHALRASCFLDPMGTIYPCSMYDRIVGNLRDSEYDIARVWRADDSRKLQREIWNYHCPQCWTPCEAYQSILGDFLQWQ